MNDEKDNRPRNLTLTEAMEHCKNGDRITRNGMMTGSYIVFMPAFEVPEMMVNARTKRHVPSGGLHVGHYFVYAWYDQNSMDTLWQPGWLPTIADMLATDWRVL